MVEILQLVHEINGSTKKVFWKTSKNSQIQLSFQGAELKDILKNFVKFKGKKYLPESSF